MKAFVKSVKGKKTLHTLFFGKDEVEKAWYFFIDMCHDFKKSKGWKNCLKYDREAQRKLLLDNSED